MQRMLRAEPSNSDTTGARPPGPLACSVPCCPSTSGPMARLLAFLALLLLPALALAVDGNGGLVTIRDNNTAVPYASTATVSGASGAAKVTLKLNGLTHAVPDDIDLILVSPSGQRALLMSDVGGSSAINTALITL